MKHPFDSRWKIAVSAAHSAPDDLPSSVPFGFATRVLAAVREAGSPPSSASLWQLLAGRLLGAMAVVLVLLAAVEYWQTDDSTPFHPTVEQSVEEQIFWLPS